MPIKEQHRKEAKNQCKWQQKECMLMQREYVKYALDMTEAILEYADEMDCTSDSGQLKGLIG